MVNGICAFERWLRQLELDLAPKDLREALESIAQEALEHFGARIWFAEIFGKRWSHIAGCGGDFPVPPEQIALTPRFGLVVEAWGRISPPEKTAFLSFLRNFLSQKSTPSAKSES